MSEAPQNTQATGVPTKPKKYMLFFVSGHRFAAPLAHIREVIAFKESTPVPGMPDYFKGLINLRGKIVSAVDLSLRLNIKDEKPRPVRRHRTVMIVQTENEVFGLIVDEVSEVLSLLESQIERKIEQLELSSQQGVVGAARIENKELTLILDLVKLGHKYDIIAA